MSTAVLLTAWRRPWLLEQALWSWSQAAAQAPVGRVVVALGRTDRAQENQDVIARMASKFDCPVSVAWQSPRALASPGPHRAIAEAADAVLAEDPACGFVVFGEEDVVVSSDALAYMHWARDKFAGDPAVLCACAHSRHGQGWDSWGMATDLDADQSAVRLLPYFSPWVWGTWRDRWEQILQPAWDYECNSGTKGFDSGYDWNIQTRVMPSRGMVCVVPDASRSQNTGRDGGIYADPADFARSQALSFRRVRPAGGYEVVT